MPIRTIKGKFIVEGQLEEYNTRLDALLALKAHKKLTRQRRVVRNFRGKPPITNRKDIYLDYLTKFKMCTNINIESE